MTSARRSRLIISLCALDILLGVFFWSQWQTYVRTKAHLDQAKANVSRISDVFGKTLAPNFVATKKQAVKNGCREKSPGLSATRIYDCNASLELTLLSDEDVSAEHTKVLIRKALDGLGAAADQPQGLDDYADAMHQTNTWFTLQPFSIPHTHIPGVPPFNYYGGAGQEDVGLYIKSAYQPESKKTTISVTAIQEYNTCKSFLLPCVNVLKPVPPHYAWE